MSAHSFASLSWQESVITHALSCKLAIYSEAFWGFSNWLWGHWRGTWKSLGIKRLYMFFCIFQSHESFLLWPGLQLNLERNVRGSCCLCFKQLSKCLRFDSLDGCDHLQSVKTPLALWCLRFAGFRCSDIRSIKSHPRVRYQGGHRDADRVNMIWSFDGKQIVT